jgi:DNA-binding MarR family transcriptional regulator
MMVTVRRFQAAFAALWPMSMLHTQPEDVEPERTLRLSRNDIRAARRLLRVLLGEEQESAGEQPAASAVGDTSREALVSRAQEEFGNRRRRAEIFGRSMFGEPAWDMLLALYILDISGQRQTVGSLLYFSGTPMTTAKRWLDFLAARDFVRREPHPTDKRTAFVSLTAKAREMLDLYYSETVAMSV